MKTNIKLKVTVNPGLLATDIMRRHAYDIFVDELLDVADYLQQKSPKGATGDLRAGWDVIAPRKETCSFTVNASIVNNAESALYRVVGRGPGAMPPYAPIAAWAAAKGFPEKTWAIRKAIALRGTLRWREKTNWVGLNPDGSLQPQSPILEAQRRIIAKLKQL